MPQRRSGIKALRVNRRRHMHNLDIKTDLKKTIKKFKALVEQKDKKEAEAKLRTVYKKLDKAVKEHLLPQNTVARRKSYFTKLLAAIK